MSEGTVTKTHNPVMLTGAGMTPCIFEFFFLDIGCGVGLGVILTFLELANMVDSTQDVGWVGGNVP